MKRFLIRMITSLCLIAVMAGSVFAARPSMLNSNEWEVLKLTNKQRTAQGAVPLSTFAALQDAAGTRSDELVIKMDHNRPDGSECFTALEGIGYTSAAENIAAGQRTATDVVTAWMNSSGHRTNILNKKLKHLGVGYTEKANTLYGRHWAQLFIGGCTTTQIVGTDQIPSFNKSGKLVSENITLEVRCDQHGSTFLPLENVSYTCNSKNFGTSTMTVAYDGLKATLPCAIGFSDVEEKAWYFDSVMYAVNNGLFNGLSETTFGPNETMTRAMLVTVLYRLEGQPGVSGGASFKDVPQNTWYTKAVKWAADHKIVNGMGNDRFAPNDNVTREQMASILYRYSRWNGRDVSALGNISAFKDAAAVSAYANKAVRWAVGEGLIKGKESNQLDPTGNATRAEVATILHRYLEG